IVLDGQACFIDRGWNHQYGLTGKLKKGKAEMDVPPSTRFVHFIGPMKPWRNWNPHQSKELFLKYQALTPWAGVALDEGFTPREIYVYSRFMYRLMFRQGRWLSGLLWYGRFLRWKHGPSA
ncbi:glycosyltransferase, partial [Azotobacter chroococcum]|nr:glycosyltransferase [Azotobacter chroococcum]